MKGSTADGREANPVRTRDVDRANRMAEHSEFAQGAQVGNPVLPAFERCPDGSVQVLRRCGRSQRSQGADRVVASCQLVDQTLLIEPREGIGRRLRGYPQVGLGVLEGELVSAF